MLSDQNFEKFMKAKPIKMLRKYKKHLEMYILKELGRRESVNEGHTTDNH